MVRVAVPARSLLEDLLVLARVDVGLGEHRQRPRPLPRDVVLAALRVLVVLDAVDPVVVERWYASAASS